MLVYSAGEPLFVTYCKDKIVELRKIGFDGLK